MRKTIHSRSHHILIAKIRALRESFGLTQKELADKIGVDQTFISKIETGDRRVDLIELREICLSLGTSLEDFIKSLEADISNERR
jgi:transcriptional regulator with XRE-family HTH domain